MIKAEYNGGSGSGCQSLEIDKTNERRTGWKRTAGSESMYLGGINQRGSSDSRTPREIQAMQLTAAADIKDPSDKLTKNAFLM